MNRDRWMTLGWISAGVVLLLVILNSVYSSPGSCDCGWRNMDPDVWYSIAALRWLDNLPTGWIENPGYPQIQLMGWFFYIASRIGLLEEISFSNIAADADPLLLLSQVVVAGWRFHGLLYSLTALIVFAFVKHLTGSNIAGFISFGLTLMSPSMTEFLSILRPDLLSALLGLASVMFAFRALRAKRLRSFVLFLLLSGSFLFAGLLQKLNIFPLLFFIPLIPFLRDDTQLDTLASDGLWAMLQKLLVLNLWLAPFSLLLMKDYLGELVSAAVPVYFAIFLLGYILSAFVLRLYLQRTFMELSRLIRRAILQAAICIAAFLFGVQLLAGLSFIHPRPNLYILATYLIGLIGGMSMLAIMYRWRSIRIWLQTERLNSFIRRSRFIYLVSFLFLVLIVAMTYNLAFGLLPKFRAYIAGTQPLGDISYAFYLVSNLTHGQKYVFSGDAGIIADISTILNAVVRYYVDVRWPEISLIGFSTLFFWNRRKDAVRTMLFLMLIGLGLSLFSTTRHLWVYRSYIVYDNLYTILAVGVCLSIFVDYFRAKLRSRTFHNRKTIMSLASSMIALSILLPTIVQPGLISIDTFSDGFGRCPVVDFDVRDNLGPDGPMYWWLRSYGGECPNC